MNRTDLMEAIGGFYVLDCESMKEAVEWATRMPNYGQAQSRCARFGSDLWF